MKAVIVVRLEVDENTTELMERATEIVEFLQTKEEKVEIHLGIRETADEVLQLFRKGSGS